MEEYKVYSWHQEAGGRLTHMKDVVAESSRKAAQKVASERNNGGSQLRETDSSVAGSEGGYVVVPANETTTYTVR